MSFSKNRVLLRRNTNNASNVFTIANLSVNCDSHEVYRDKTPIKLSTREFTILEYMIRNKEKVLPREKLNSTYGITTMKVAQMLLMCI